MIVVLKPRRKGQILSINISLSFVDQYLLQLAHGKISIISTNNKGFMNSRSLLTRYQYEKKLRLS